LSKCSPGKGLVSIGKITGVHGLDGNIKVFSHSGFTSSYDSGARLVVRHDDEDTGHLYTIDWAKPFKKGILLKFKGVDRSLAEACVGASLYINKSELPELEEDTYYWFELIGLEVFTTENEYIGDLISIFPTGSNDVYVVKKEDKEILLPAISSVIQTIDPEGGKMIVTLPEGL